MSPARMTSAGQFKQLDSDAIRVRGLRDASSSTFASRRLDLEPSTAELGYGGVQSFPFKSEMRDAWGASRRSRKANACFMPSVVVYNLTVSLTFWTLNAT